MTVAAPPALRRTHRALPLLALVLWLLLLGFSFTDLTLPTRAVQIAAYLAAFAVFCVAVGIAWRLGHRASGRAVWFVVLAGVFFRLSLAPMRPVTTSDVYRYLWEGRIINRGHNPFAERPNSPQLAPLHDWVWERMDFKSVPAAYPPTAQYVFALADRIPADRIITLKLVLAGFDIGTVLLLPGLLRRLRRPPVWVLLYAWHPLVVGEVVARGHLDSIGIFFLVLAMRLFLWEAARGRALTGVSLAASVLAKGYAVFLLPSFFIAARPRRGWFVLGVVTAGVALYLPFASAGVELWRGIGLYSTRWQGYASIYQVVQFALGPLVHDPSAMARRVCAVAFVGWMGWVGWRLRHAREKTAALDAGFLALAGFYLLSPVLYPWYLAWTVPFLCVRPRPGWVLFTGTVFLFYAHGFAPPHVEIGWVKALEYGPPLVLGVVLWRRKRRADGARPQGLLV